MSTQFVVEGSSTENEMQQWLSKNKIDIKYAEAFDTLGVKSTEDLKLITTTDEFQGLIDEISNYLASKNMSITYMDRIKLKKAWNALVPTQQNKSQTIPMGPKERASLESLAKYMHFIQKEMIILDECLNGAQLEKYCNQIRNESKSLQQSIQKRENELVQDAKNKFAEIAKEQKIKQQQLESLALNMNGIKKKCDNALQMNEYSQLEERRNIICNAVQSVQKLMEKVMTQNVECSMKTVKLDLSDCNVLNSTVVKFGQVFIQLPFDITIKNVTMAGITLGKYGVKVVWQIENGKYLYENCDSLVVSIIQQDADQKVNDEQKENVIGHKRVQGDLSTRDCAEFEINQNELQKNCFFVFRINVLNKSVEKLYKYEQPRVDFIGYVEWFQNSKFSCKEEDDAMNKACNDKFKGSRAATDSEVIQGKIKGLTKCTTQKPIFAHSGGNDLWKANSYSSGNRQFGRHYWYNQWPFNANDYKNNGFGFNGLTIAVKDVYCLKEM